MAAVSVPPRTVSRWVLFGVVLRSVFVLGGGGGGGARALATAVRCHRAVGCHERLTRRAVGVRMSAFVEA